MTGRPNGRGRGRVLALGLGAIALTALIPIVVLALLLRGGGDDDDGEASANAAALTTAQKTAAFPLFWAGEAVAGLPLSGVVKSGAATTALYGDCTPAAGQTSCARPIAIQTASVCERNPLVVDLAPRDSRTVRGVGVFDYGDGTQSLQTGTSNVTIFTRAEYRDQVLAALRPLQPAVAGTASGDLPQARYPLAYVISLRLVRDAYRRLGSVRAVRNEIGISQSAVRRRLEYAGALGGERLRRPAAQFVDEGGCRLEPAP